MNDYSLSLLQVFKDRHRLSLSELGAILNTSPLLLSGPIKELVENDYLKPDFPNDEILLNTRLELTGKGMLAFADLQKRQKNFRYSEFRNWTTTVIAVLAFILSIIALVKP